MAELIDWILETAESIDDELCKCADAHRDNEFHLQKVQESRIKLVAAVAQAIK